MTTGTRDWVEWHRGYEDPDSRLNRRVGHVRRLLAAALDAAPPGPIRLLSLCAGEGRDVLGVLPSHPRRDDATARLVELDPELAGRARTAAAEAGLADRVEIVEGDAGTTDAAVGMAPVDVLLLCGIFGNIPTWEVARTVRAAASLCRPGATVLWTRHADPPDLTPHVRRWFAESGFDEIEFVAERSAVGAHRLVREPDPFVPDRRLFSFGRPRPLVVDDAVLRRVSGVTDRYMLRRLELFGPAVTLTDFGDTVVAPAAPDLPDLDFVNRVLGLRPEHVGLVPEIVDHYRSLGLRPWFEVAPFDGVSDLFDALTATGARQIGVHGMYAGRPGPVEPAAPPPGVAVVWGDDVDPVRFGHTLAEGLEIDPAARAGAAASFAEWEGEPGWHVSEALVDGTAVGAGVLAVDDGVGYLATAATIAPGRGRGAQTVLIRSRMAVAASDGCDVIAALAAPNSTSARNMNRAGIAPLATLSTWRLFD